MAKQKATLDRSKPFAVISSLDPKSPVYEQEGLYFGQDEKQCGEVKGYAERQKAAEEKAAAAEEASKKEAEAAAAESILGDLGDPQADSLAENAAADAAEASASED